MINIPAKISTEIRYSRGASERDANPRQLVADDFSAFARAVLADRSDGGGLAYVCAPFRGNGEGRYHRCKEGALPRRFLGFDYDAGSPDDFSALCVFMSHYSGFMYTTRSHAKEKPRARFILETSREVSREEGERLGEAMHALIGPIPLDASVWRGEQPMFLPIIGRESKVYTGPPVDVDEVLKHAPPEIGNQIGKPRAGSKDDLYLELIDAMGMRLTEGGNGKTPIRCPFAAEHTVDNGFGNTSTVYLWPHYGGFARGKISCLHAHCADRTQDDYIRKLGRDPAALWRKPTIVEGAREPGEDDDKGEGPKATGPAPLGAAAFHGLAGEVARAIEPLTESDTTAILVQTLVLFGAMVGRAAHFSVEADLHHCNLFVLLIGGTATARKGTSLNQVRSIFDLCEACARVISGISTGEGLKFQLRDPSKVKPDGNGRGKKVAEFVDEYDEGVADKRVVVIEPEFDSVIKVASRPGATLSTTIRNAWDTGNLATLTRTDPITVTNAHISIIGHITASELVKGLSDTEAKNGFMNRFLLVSVRRSKCMPSGSGCLNEAVRRDFAQRLAHAAGNANGRMEITLEAQGLWTNVYEALSAERPELINEITARGAPYVMRLALIYALLDERTAIHAVHLRAALAVWEYCEDSARHVFGEGLLSDTRWKDGDEVAGKIVGWLQKHKAGLAKNEIRDLFCRNLSSEKINQALWALERAGIISLVVVETGRRPKTVCKLV